MATVTDLNSRRAVRPRRGNAGTFVTCTNCGEKHPIIRLAGGIERCLTAFLESGRWFCRNRGCRAIWLERQRPPR